MVVLQRPVARHRSHMEQKDKENDQAERFISITKLHALLRLYP